MYFGLYEGAWISADSTGIWKNDRSKINIICFFQNHPPMNKVYVDVVAEFRKDGQLVPIFFTWEDGRKYSIDRILKIERCASRKAGGVGMMYTCMIQGQESHLFYEVDKWFMERKTA